jgi:methionine sulfoxide reductase heme-binding subunit
VRRYLKPLVFIAALGPFLWLAFRAATDRLSVNPIEDLTLTTGIWALRFLVITLAITPIRRLTGWNAVIQYRRMLGLFAFFYATLHFLVYIVLDQFFAFEFILADIAKRPYITAGTAALLLMVPLAVTSTRGWIRRLGRRWQRLHRLVYVSAIAGVLHYYWKVKADTTYPLRYALLLALFFAIRLWWVQRSAQRQERTTAA